MIILIIFGMCCHAVDSHMHKYAKIPPPIINGPHEVVEIDTYSVIRNWYEIMNCYTAKSYPCKMIPPFIGKHVKCLSKDQVCDGLEQCPYGDDEDGNCGELAYYCRAGQIRCRDGRCATACDGLVECKYGSDEIYCKKDDKQEFPCGMNQLLCADGKCAEVCDGKKQCQSGEDEIKCLPQCGIREMICPGSGKCAQYCDGNPECEHKEDELFCPDTRVAEILNVPKNKIDCETRNGLAECICLQDRLPDAFAGDFPTCMGTVLDMLSDFSFLK